MKVTSISADGKSEKIHGNYCGKIPPPLIVTSETNRLRVEFNSDTSVQKSGFAAVFFTGKLLLFKNAVYYESCLVVS